MIWHGCPVYLRQNITLMENKSPNLDEIREELKKIETDIKNIVGPGKDGWVEIPESADRERLEELLQSRSYCLDILFRKDPRGIEKFTKINTLLKDLSDRVTGRDARSREAISGEKPPGSAHLARPGNRKSARKIN